MRIFLKVLGLAVMLAVLFAAGFALWGDRFESLLNQEANIRWFSQTKSYGWTIGFGLLVSDLLLPIPATGIIAALGTVYGVAVGTFIGVLGTTGAGLIGYVLARFAGRRVTRAIATDKELERFRSFFEEWGAVAVIVSRALPILPEVVAILAGLAMMTPVRFVAALLFGTIPVSFLCAYLGHAARSVPAFGVFIAAVLPLALWPVFLRIIPGARERIKPPRVS